MFISLHSLYLPYLCHMNFKTLKIHWFFSSIFNKQNVCTKIQIDISNLSVTNFSSITHQLCDYEIYIFISLCLFIGKIEATITYLSILLLLLLELIGGDLNELTRKLLQVISTYIKVALFTVGTLKRVVILFINDNCIKKEIRHTVLLITI